MAACMHTESMQPTRRSATIYKATAIPINNDICAAVLDYLSSSAPGTTTARVPDDLGSPAPGKTTVRVRDDLGSSAPDTTTVRVPNDLGSPVPRTATTPGRADLPVSLHGHGDAPWLHWLPRQPVRSRQSATRRLHTRLHANTCAVGRVGTHTNKKLASYSGIHEQ